MDVCRDGSLAHWISSCGWAVLVGAQDAVFIREIQRQCPRLLVIEPSQRRVERLRSSWSQLPNGLRFWQEPVGAAEEDVLWYSYNDSRLDGTIPPADLSKDFKNISLIGEETRRQYPLENVVNEWLDIHDSPLERGGLLVRNFDPDPLIAGAASLLPSLEFLILWTESATGLQPAPISEDLAMRLEEACFSRSTQEEIRWERDEKLHLKHQLQSLEATVTRLSFENSEQTRFLQGQEREVMELTESRLALITQCDQLTSQCHSLRDALQLARQQSEDLGKQSGKLEAEQAELRASVAGLKQQVQESDQQREDLLAKLAELQHQGTHQEKRLEGLTGELQSLHAQNAAWSLERETLVSEKSRLAEENEQLQIGNQDLRRRLNELSRLTDKSEQEMALLRELVIQASIRRDTEKEIGEMK